MQVAVHVEPPSGDDRAVAIEVAGGYVVALADGAGGTGNGALAAELLIAFVTRRAASARSIDWFDALCAFDDELAMQGRGGETTAVVAFVDAERVRGASVGDSSAWLIDSAGAVADLTASQRRKPLLGSGEALPVEFAAELGSRRLLVGSDGLFKYAPAERIAALVMAGPVDAAARAVAATVRLPSGALADDVAVVVASA